MVDVDNSTKCRIIRELGVTIPVKNYEIFGGIDEGEYMYLALDKDTGTVYLGENKCGEIFFEKLTPKRYHSLRLGSPKKPKGTPIEYFAGFLFPDLKNDSMLFAKLPEGTIYKRRIECAD